MVISKELARDKAKAEKNYLAQKKNARECYSKIKIQNKTNKNL